MVGLCSARGRDNDGRRSDAEHRPQETGQRGRNRAGQMPDHVSERKDYVSQVAAVACSPSNVGFVVEAPQRTLDRVEQFDNRGGLPTVATDCRPTSNADIAQLTNCDRERPFGRLMITHIAKMSGIVSQRPTDRRTQHRLG